MILQAITNSAEDQKPRVLVVDDMAANRAVICRRLERCGYSITSVESGKESLEMLRQMTPDIILLDYMMPEMNGIEVLQKLRSADATKDIPVIMVTARAESEATVEALEAGADDYVTKPIDFEVLRARIDTHVSKRSKATDLHRANAALDERVTRRSLTLADIEQELHEEIERRKSLEARLAVAGGAAGQTPFVASAELTGLLDAAVERMEFVFEIATSGRAPNLAQMADLRAMLQKARQLARD